MKPSIFSFILVLSYFLFQYQGYGQSAPTNETSVSASALAEDYQIFKNAVMNLHPGLYRFQSEEEVAALFDTFESSLNRDMTHTEVYLAFSRFVPQLLCSHTLVNPFNQEDSIKRLLFETNDKLPFEFKLIDRRMVVTRSATDSIEQGMEILSINQTPVSSIVDQLMQYVSSDGSNDGKRIYELQLTGTIQYELFDIYLPLLYPPTDKGYTIEATRKEKATPVRILATPMSRSERTERIAQRHGPGPQSYDDLWRFEILDEQTGYLQIGTFVTYKMSLDWKGFLREAFAALEEQNIPNLILDIRGNSGGMDIVGKTLLEYISTKPVTIPAMEDRMAYDKVPDDVRPYISTWDESAFDLSQRVEDTGKGYFVYRNAQRHPKTYQPKPNAYKGMVYLLVDAANSSNTFFVARTAKANQLATLIGEPTGGNLMGTNGGIMAFLRLPHSKVEVDIPLFGYYPLDQQPDRGVIPHVVIRPTVEDAQNGVDTILEAAKHAIAKR